MALPGLSRVCVAILHSAPVGAHGGAEVLPYKCWRGSWEGQTSVSARGGPYPGKTLTHTRALSGVVDTLPLFHYTRGRTKPGNLAPVDC